MTEFSYSGTVLAFNCDPVKTGNGQQINRHQALGRYSDGSAVVYDKSGVQRGAYALVFTRISSSVLDGLLAFFALVQGVRYPFSWTDHAGITRTARFTQGSIQFTQTGPDRYSLTLDLLVDDAL